MSRHGYIEDDGDDPLAQGRWRGMVKSAIRGRRGQQLLRDMLAALDAMPEKRLITKELVEDAGDVCALGAVAVARKLDVSLVDPEDPDQIAAVFDISDKLAREIAFENDGFYESNETPEQRWSRMRRWVTKQIIGAV